MNAEELEQIWELLDRITTYPESAVDNVDEINEVLARFRDLAPVPSGEVETPSYCGCCGREITQGTTEWCMDCLRDHIDTLATRPEEATFFAQHGTNCPFEAGEVETPCATCGGRGAIPSPWSPDDLDAEQSPCPDCGVETPEAAGDWTVNEEGRSNSSERFLALCDEVERIIRGEAHQLIGGRADMTARLVMAQLAHVHGLVPAQGWTPPGGTE